MKGKLLLVAALWLLPASAFAQMQTQPVVVTGTTSTGAAIVAPVSASDSVGLALPVDEHPSNYTHISTNASTVISTVPVELHVIDLNTQGGTGETATIYDNATCTGTIVAVIDLSKQAGTSQRYDIKLGTGLCITTGGGTAGDITVVWHPWPY